MVSTIFVVKMQAILIAFFIGETTYSESEYSVKEYIAVCDIMAMLLLGFGYLMTFLKKYGMGASCFHHDVVFLSMELNIVVEFCVRLLYSEKGEDTAWPMPNSMATLIGFRVCCCDFHDHL